jgi:hypothetical protein
MSAAQRAAFEAAQRDFFIDLDDRSLDAERDLAEYRDELGMTERDYGAWTNPKQSGT